MRAPRTRSLLELPTPLLGGLSPQTFMSQYWQKKPLLIRGAAPEYIDRFPVDDLFELAGSDDVESRLVSLTQPSKRAQPQWRMEHGPIDDDRRAQLSSALHRHWTLLVQGVNLYDEDAATLLNRFRFIPDARLDDLMISYAVDGGGVGPHFDSYDVFLLQTHGTRRWRISEQSDLSLDERQPMKILRHFQAEQEWVLEPGDMLYLPPKVAHEGVAIGECITCSIGFRAPNEAELIAQFLHRMAEQVESDTRHQKRYTDRTQPAIDAPAALPEQLVETTLRLVDTLKWRKRDVSAFLGEYLSEPKSNVFFDPPHRPLSRAAFEKRVRARGLLLDLGTRMLYDRQTVFINGEQMASLKQADAQPLRRLANKRFMEAADLVTLSNDSSIVSALFEWYLAGWIHCGR